MENSKETCFGHIIFYFLFLSLAWELYRTVSSCPANIIYHSFQKNVQHLLCFWIGIDPHPEQTTRVLDLKEFKWFVCLSLSYFFALQLLSVQMGVCLLLPTTCLHSFCQGTSTLAAQAIFFLLTGAVPHTQKMAFHRPFSCSAFSEEETAFLMLYKDMVMVRCKSADLSLAACLPASCCRDI